MFYIPIHRSVGISELFTPVNQKDSCEYEGNGWGSFLLITLLWEGYEVRNQRDIYFYHL